MIKQQQTQILAMQILERWNNYFEKTDVHRSPRRSENVSFDRHNTINNACSWFLLLCRIHFPWLFPDFPGQNESFSLTNLFMRNTNVGFQSLAIAFETIFTNVHTKIEICLVSHIFFMFVNIKQPIGSRVWRMGYYSNNNKAANIIVCCDNMPVMQCTINQWRQGSH